MATTQIIEITEEENQHHRNPHFFKVFFSDSYSLQLVIPPAFGKHIGQEGLGPCSIRGPSGNIWNINLIKREEKHFCFNHGWPNFARDHSLQTGDFLVFEYHGNRHFSVLILDPSACDKEIALHAQPSTQPRSVTRRSLRLRALATSKGLKDGTEIKRNAGCVSDECTGKSDSFVVSTQKMDEVSNFSTKRNFISSGRSAKIGYAALIDDSRLSSEQSRQRLVSQRRSVTEKVNDRILERAMRFSSKKPFFILPLGKSSVYPHFKMRIPTDFANKYIPDTLKNSVLVSPSGKRYPSKLLKVGSTRFPIPVWRSFSMENNLEKGDACVFELINNRKIEFQTHVHKAVRKR